MKRLMAVCALLVATFTTAYPLAAQDQTSEEKPGKAIEPKSSSKGEVKYFRLDFIMKELDGSNVVNSRAYSISIAADPNGDPNFTRSIQTGISLPVQPNVGQMSYVNIGTNIGCRHVHMAGSELAMIVAADTTSLLLSGPPQDISTGVQHVPASDQNRWSSDVVLPIGKTTVLFSSDDVASKRTMQLSVTATPIRVE